MADDLATAEHSVWNAIAPRGGRGGFTRAEFHYPDQMSAGFLRGLWRARRASGVPFRIVSDHRPPARNEAAGGATRSAHLEVPCRCVDLRVLNNLERYHVVEALLMEGFERVGIYPPTPDQVATYGRGAGSIHVDDSPHNPRPRVWVSF